MITLLASLTGFVSSVFPDIIRLFFDKNDKMHELAILDRQIAMQKLGFKNRLDEVGVQADIAETRALYGTFKTGIGWVDALNGTVRPVLAYFFFILYAVVKLLQFIIIWRMSELNFTLEVLWTNEDQAIFAGIISFYFGQRALAKLRGY